MQAHQLAEQARLCRQDGDVIAALRLAREALSLHPDCSSIHALLGHLYEQHGNHSAAQYHFQAALHITPGAPAEQAVAPLPVSAPYPQQNGWMAVVLVACILFSGLAAVFSLWPDKQRVERGAIIQMPVEQRPPLPDEPRWAWTLPPPAGAELVATPGHHPEAATPVTDTSQARTVATHQPPEDTAPKSVPTGVQPVSVVLGPSTRPRVVANPAEPSVEQADQAYFHGDYERAVIIYEGILQREDTPHPRLHQDLAWCYQQLGNSRKAAQHLGEAVQGYQQMAKDAPDSTTAQQGLASCRAALSTLLSTKDTP